MKLEIKKYAIEFAVIFMSITMSFLVDEWRTNQQEKKVTREFFQRLKAELDQKTLETQQYLDNNRQLIIDNEKVAINFKTREISDDSLFYYMVASEHLGSIDPELTTWESLKSSGVFAHIKPQIIDSVNSLLRQYKGVQSGNKYLDDLYLQTWPHILPDIPSAVITNKWMLHLHRNEFPSNLELARRGDMDKVLNNSIAIDYFFTRALYANAIQHFNRSLPEKEKRLIELIEKEIEE